MTPDDVQALFDSNADIHDHDESGHETVLPETEKHRRIERLKEVLDATQQLWAANSDEIDLIAEKLGDGGRDVSWRIPLGESGLLDLFLGIIATGSLRQPLKIHALRVIGNSCADTDANRARVVASNTLPALLQLLGDDSILPFAIPVLYNICVDYEPAQLQACNAGLNAALIDIVSGPRLQNCQAFLNIICKLLGLMAAQAPEPSMANPSTPFYLLRIAIDPLDPVDFEDFISLVSVAAAYLSHESFQENFVTAGAVPSLLTAFSDSYTRFDAAEGDPDDVAQLKQVRAAFTQVLADLSSMASFASIYPLNSPIVNTLQSWLRSGRGYTGLESAACLVLGNLSRSDQASTYLIQQAQIHVPLVTLLSSPDRHLGSQLLHSILSFLKNLAIPAANKPLLGSLLLSQPSNILPRLWTTTDTQPQVQFTAISLSRLLLVGCSPNVRLICAPLSPDPASPAHDRSNLHMLCGLFERIDAEHSKLEAARAVVTVCRTLHTAPVRDVLPGEDDGAADQTAITDGQRRARFYETHAAINRPLSFLVTQPRFPALRSEAWFVFALMSRTPEGAVVVARALNPFEACRALVEAVSGRDMVDGRLLAGLETEAGATPSTSTQMGSASDVASSLDGLGLQPQQVDPAQAASMAKIDRENGLVLLAEILKNHGEDIQSYRNAVFEELLRTGGEMVLHQRRAAEGSS